MHCYRENLQTSNDRPTSVFGYVLFGKNVDLSNFMYTPYVLDAYPFVRLTSSELLNWGTHGTEILFTDTGTRTELY